MSNVKLVASSNMVNGRIDNIPGNWELIALAVNLPEGVGWFVVREAGLTVGNFQIIQIIPNTSSITGKKVEIYSIFDCSTGYNQDFLI